MNRLAGILAVSALILSGCDSGPAEGAGGTIVEPSSSAPAPTPGTPSETAPAPTPGTPSETAPAPSAEAAVGTRGNPAPLGATAKINDWDVRIVDVNRDAADIVRAENMFNDEPAEGRSFVLWTIEATYTGTESGDPWSDLDSKIVGSAGNSFDDRCGVIPDSLRDAGETFAGGVITANICVSADPAQLDGGTILVEENFGGSRTFFAIP